MTHNGVAVPTTNEIKNRDQLGTVLEAAIATAENIVSHERDQENGHNLGEGADLSPLLGLMDEESQTLAALSNKLSSLDVEAGSQRENWEPGDPCSECGSTRLSVINTREMLYDYNDNGDVVGTAPGEVNGPELDHFCRECETILSEHPAIAIFGLH